MQSFSTEDGVTTNEFYYLLLVLGAFGAFAVGVSAATIQYRGWLRRTGSHRHVVSTVPAGLALARTSPVLSDAA